MAASDKLNQGTTTAVVVESVQDSTSDRIIYSPDSDIVDEEGIYIIEPLDTNSKLMLPVPEKRSRAVIPSKSK